MDVAAETNQLRAKFERTLAIDGSAQINARTESGWIRVVPGSDNQVIVRGYLRAQRSFFGWGNIEDRLRLLEQNPPIEQSGNAIRIGDPVDSSILRGIVLLVEITAPHNSSVVADADSGSIYVEGVKGPVSCTTDSGRIEIFNTDSDVRASTDSGSVEMRAVKGSVFCETDAGFITTLEVGGSIDVQSDSGRVNLSQTAAASIRARTDSGQVSIRLADAGYHLKIRTDHGPMHVPSLTNTEQSRHELRGMIRGGGPMIDVETDSGGIDILEAEKQ